MDTMTTLRERILGGETTFGSWLSTGSPAVPEWLSGSQFSPWPTWASIGRGGATLYFIAR